MFYRSASFLRLPLLIVAVSVGVSGCMQARYRASDLPRELSASTVNSARRIDLANLAHSTANSELIYPGDVLMVTIGTGLEETAPMSWPLRVADDGVIEVPIVGPVRVGGMLLPEAEQNIRRESIHREVYRNPNVSVLLEERRSVRVTVVGAVKEPGTYDVPAINSDLLTAIVSAGGLTDKASTIVEIRNTSANDLQQVSHDPSRRTVTNNGSVRIDLVESHGGMQTNQRITDGSIIMVREQEPKTIQVIGLVKRPDQFDVEPDKEVHLLDAIAMAGGRTLQIADKVQVIRNLGPGTEPVVIATTIREAKRGGSANLLLAPGDVVSVEETPLTFTVGTLQSFVRFGFSSAIPGF